MAKRTLLAITVPAAFCRRALSHLTRDEIAILRR
jgi:hypothetical protein